MVLKTLSSIICITRLSVQYSFLFQWEQMEISRLNAIHFIVKRKNWEFDYMDLIAVLLSHECVISLK